MPFYRDTDATARNWYDNATILRDNVRLFVYFATITAKGFARCPISRWTCLRERGTATTD